jgi:hypothetical protein
MTHCVLLGDSIFDNAVYVPPGQDVTTHLQQMLDGRNADSKVTLLAVDGAIAEEVAAQVKHVPADATQLFLSVGGNDLLRKFDLLNARASTVADALLKLGTVMDELSRRYLHAVDACRGTGVPLCLCAVYGCSFPDARTQACADLIVSLFHDRIRQVAEEHRFPVIDLRRVCWRETDFVRSIEPSATGGWRIATTLAGFVGQATGSATAQDRR